MAQQRMSATLTRLARTRGRLPALVTAALMALLILVQGVASSLVGWLTSSLYQRVSFGADAFEWDPWNLSYVIDPFLMVTLPFSVGAFVSLWLIAPLAAELGLRFVATRALLAAAAGTVLVFVVAVFVDLVRMLGFGFDIRGFAHSVVIAFNTGVSVFIYTTPIVVLAAVLLWLWLRAHPREYEVAGLIDEV